MTEPSRRFASVAIFVAMLVAFCGVPIEPAAAADQALPLKAFPSAPPAPPTPRLPCGVGVTLGGVFGSNTGVSSSSGFYQGGYGNYGAPYAGVFADCAIASFGPPNVPFRSWTLGFDPLVDANASSINFSGTGGGFPVTGTGSLVQADFLALLRMTTPLQPGYKLSFFGGLGAASLWPHGMPTGFGGPSFTGSGWTPAFRLGVELWKQTSANIAVGLQLTYQHTNPVSFATTLPDERFEFRGSDRVMLGFDLKFGDNGENRPPLRPGFTQDAGGGGKTTDKPQTPKTESKDWSSTSKLTWNDFTGSRPPDAPTDEAAAVYSGYTEVECDCKGGKLVCKKKSHGFMDPSQSYVDAGEKSDLLLKHEQGHFDISELYARKLNKKLSETVCKAGDKVSDLIKAVTNDINTELDKAQADYNDKTGHGTDAKAQDAQSKDIQKQLDGLKDYKG